MIDVEGRLETGGLSCAWGARAGGATHRPRGLVRRALAAPWRKPGAPWSKAAVSAKMDAVFGGSTRLCLRRRPMTAP
jgi:hypothetical protein